MQYGTVHAEEDEVKMGVKVVMSQRGSVRLKEGGGWREIRFEGKADSDFSLLRTSLLFLFTFSPIGPLFLQKCSLMTHSASGILFKICLVTSLVSAG